MIHDLFLKTYAIRTDAEYADGTDAQLGRYDASVGALLIGDGSGAFQVVSPADSDLSIPGNVSSIVPVKSGNELHLFIARNGDRSSLFRLKQG